ncbi:unnamed protein product [Paramecium octaurelia]|uniref:Tetratricopeptide repeat protein n=1 Tax=Paramecium octaurelia TaxID=43137 RepID=A0A8S1Y6P7_PAROT|nr:unnamed protein product [Paramecium octaurelia]
MNQSCDINTKCPNPQHSKDVKLVCFDESCQGQRLYCHECIKLGIHASHPQYQEELSFIFHHIERVKKECDNLINNMNKQMDAIQQDFQLLIEGIRSKYQISKQLLLGLDSEQINSLLSQTIYFKQFEQTFQNKLQKFTNEFLNQISKLMCDLHLNESIDYQVSKIHLNKSEELYQQGIKSSNQDINYIWKIKNLMRHLKYLIKHQFQILNINYHYGAKRIVQGSLVNLMKQSFKQIKHCKQIQNIVLDYLLKLIAQNRLVSIMKQSYKQIKHYKQIQSIFLHYILKVPIIFSEEADSLKLLEKFTEALEVIEQCLKLNPNHFDSLGGKGYCLQNQNQYEKAILCYNKALEINSNDQWTKNRKSIVIPNNQKNVNNTSIKKNEQHKIHTIITNIIIQMLLFFQLILISCNLIIWCNKKLFFKCILQIINIWLLFFCLSKQLPVIYQTVQIVNSCNMILVFSKYFLFKLCRYINSIENWIKSILNTNSESLK